LVPRGHTGQAKPDTVTRTSPREAAITERTERTAPTALVGGGATGIGFAVAERLAPTHRVVLTGRRAGALEKAAALLSERTGAVVGTLPADIAAPDDAAALLDAMTARYAPPDVLVLNAGGPPPGRILDVTDDAWRSAAELLLLGPLRLARLALPGMAARGFGRLVLVTSTAVRQPQRDLAISVVLRAAVTAAAKLLSHEYAASGVTVNCVAPGATDTQRRRDVLASRAARAGRPLAELDAADTASVPAGRTGTPGEIAAAVAFLASADAGYVNGTVLTVDGGRTEAF
jgi:3-oxoacyl-[acyl-carrier protein] reductase